MNSGKVLDLGGTKHAEYHKHFGLNTSDVIVWNLNPATEPDVIVDFESISTLPPLPKNCSTILAVNLLEHLFRPFELMKWACEQLPNQGKFIALVPFLYSIHGSPQDYWRMTPQTFRKFFSELAEKQGLSGSCTITSLGQDFRDGTSPWTANLFKSALKERILGSLIETVGIGVEVLTKIVLGKAASRDWVDKNPLAIAVVWTKVPSKLENREEN